MAVIQTALSFIGIGIAAVVGSYALFRVDATNEGLRLRLGLIEQWQADNSSKKDTDGSNPAPSSAGDRSGPGSDGPSDQWEEPLMPTFMLELCVHRVGGPEGERRWGPWNVNSGGAGQNNWSIPGSEHQGFHMTVRLMDVVQVDAEWYSGLLELTDCHGIPIGTIRPVKWFGQVWDVPTYNTIYDHWRGAYVVGIRCPYPMPPMELDPPTYPVTERA